MREYPETKVSYRGETFDSPGYRDAPAQYRIVTDDEATALRLGFTPSTTGAGRFERWVDLAEAERVVKTYAHGIYHGARVVVYTENADSYVIQSDRDLPGLEQLERGVYYGEVPKAALERFWTEDEERRP